MPPGMEPGGDLEDFIMRILPHLSRVPAFAFGLALTLGLASSSSATDPGAYHDP